MAKLTKSFENQEPSIADSTSHLVNLPLELKAIMASYLDFTSTINLASTLPSLQRLLLESPSKWRMLLSKVPWNTQVHCITDKGLCSSVECPNKQSLRDILKFLPPNSPRLFSDLLISVCSNFKPENDQDWLEVKVNISDPPLRLSPLGLIVLATADDMWRRSCSSNLHEPTFQLLNVNLRHLQRPYLIMTLAYTTAKQKNVLNVASVDLVSVCTEKEAKRLGRFLQQCQRWRVQELELLGQVSNYALMCLVITLQVGQAGWSALANAIGSGKISMVTTTRLPINTILLS